ncbi:MAG TPA: LysR family transcriptional regulator [Dokdonella sp.]
MAVAEVNLNRLAVFVAVARAGSFTAAAEQLGSTKAMASQHVARLEKELGVSLLLRSTRRMALTEAGALFHADCVRILGETEAAIERVGENRDRPTGTLRVGAASDHGPSVVAPALATFVRLHPQVKVELVVSDRIADPIAERFDVSVRIGWLRDSRLHAVRLGAFRQRLVAAPSYLAAAGTPRHPEELAQHAWISLSVLPSPLHWTFSAAAGARRSVRVNAVAEVNSTLSAYAMALAGAGLSVLPDYLVEDAIGDGRLVPLLRGYRLPDGGIYAVYSGRHPPAKVRAFIAHLRAATQ